MSTLVFVEHHGDELQKGSLGVLAKAATLGDVVGGARRRRREGARLRGRRSTARPRCTSPRTTRSSRRCRRRASTCSRRSSQDGGYDTVLFANSVLAADIAAGLAARLDAGLNWDLVDLESRDGTLVGKRPALQDSVLVDVGWKTTPRLALFRAGSFDAAPTGRRRGRDRRRLGRVRGRTRAARRSSTTSRSSRAARRSRTPTSSSRAVAASARRRTSRSPRSSRGRSAAPSARRAPSSTRAGTRTRRRSGRRARSCRRSSTSRSASPARSSTRSACRART